MTKSKREEMKILPGKPCNVYKKLVVEAPSEINAHEVSAPRNFKQVQNFQAAERQKLKLTQDEMYNLLELARTNKLFKLMLAWMYSRWEWWGIGTAAFTLVNFAPMTYLLAVSK